MSARYYLNDVLSNVWAFSEQLEAADDSVLMITEAAFAYHPIRSWVV